MIEAKDVSCTFARNPFSKEGFVAVSPVSIQFIDGERYAIVGESGSGKTTLARMIAGLQRPTAGNIYANGTVSYTPLPAPETDSYLLCRLLLVKKKTRHLI